MNKKDAIEITESLIKAYPDATCSLNFQTSFEMLVAVCLSAQCTDERVNKVTPTLFKKLHTPEDFANAKLADIENLIYSCGFYKNKAKNLKLAGKKIINDFDGQVPQTMEELTQIPRCWEKKCKRNHVRSF